MGQSQPSIVFMTLLGSSAVLSLSALPRKPAALPPNSLITYLDGRARIPAKNGSSLPAPPPGSARASDCRQSWAGESPSMKGGLSQSVPADAATCSLSPPTAEELWGTGLNLM